MPPWQGAWSTLKTKKRSERHKHCALAVVRRSQTKFRLAADPIPGAQDGLNLISWRWLLPLPIQTQFGEDRCTQFRVIVVTNPQTNTHKHTHTHTHTNPLTGPITIHCTAASLARSVTMFSHLVWSPCKIYLLFLIAQWVYVVGVPGYPHFEGKRGAGCCVVRLSI